MTDNLSLWDSVAETDPANTKKVEFGRKFTAIDAHSQIKRATEKFGPVGIGWGWAIDRIEYLTEIKNVAILIRIWHGEESNAVFHWGQAGLFTDNAQSKPDDDCMKKATTDGITKCLAMLGFSADVFLGKFDDNKYVDRMRAKFGNQELVRKATAGIAAAVDAAAVEKCATRLAELLLSEEISTLQWNELTRKCENRRSFLKDAAPVSEVVTESLHVDD